MNQNPPFQVNANLSLAAALAGLGLKGVLDYRLPED